MGSSPVAFKYFCSLFFDFFILDFVNNWIGLHLFDLACVYVTNTAPRIISLRLHVIYSLHAKYLLRLLLSSADF